VKKTFIIIAFCLGVCACHGSARAGSVTQTNITWQSMNETEIEWVITTNEYVSGSITDIDGLIERIVFVAATTTNANTITLSDQDGVDLFVGQGTVSNFNVNVYADNADTSLPIAVSAYAPYTFLVTNSTLGVSVTTNGTVRIYWR